MAWSTWRHDCTVVAITVITVAVFAAVFMLSHKTHGWPTWRHDCKVAFPYALVGVTLAIVAVFSAVFMLSNRISDLRTWLALSLTATFIVLCVGTFALIVAFGGKTMTFEPGFLNWLGGVTIAEVAGIVGIVFNFFFKPASEAGAVTPK
jgi:hypothetical protein